MAQARSTPMPTLMEAAMAYASVGWAVFPLQTRGKRPRTAHGYLDSTTDPEKIGAWWRRWPDANVGIAVPAGLQVLDLDSPDSLQELSGRGLTVPTTLTATTGRGQHLWYAIGEAPARSMAGLFPGVDLRATGGYVVAPPSVHSNGKRYQWEEGFSPDSISDSPEWLLERVTCSRDKRRTSPSDWHRRIAEPVHEGARNQRLAEVAGLLFRQHPAAVAAELAWCWAQAKLRPPLPEREIQRTLDSIAGRELRQRGERP